MKKLIVLALMVAMISGAAFAQFTLGGYINSGLGVTFTDAEDSDPTLRAFGVDSESQGYRFRLNGSAQSEDRKVGGRFRLQSQRDLSNTGYLSIPFAYGFMNFFENKLYTAAGLVDDGTYTTQDWWFNDDVSNRGLGVFVRAMPVDGLSLGVGAFTINQLSGGSNNGIAGGTPNFRDRAILLDEAKFTVNVAYTMKDTFYLGVGYRTENKAAWSGNIMDNTDPNNPVDTGKYNYSRDNFEFDQLVAEFRLLAVKNLTTVVVLSMDNFGDSENQNIMISETFAYKVSDEINVGLNAVQFLYNRAADVDPGLLFNLWGSYTIGDIIPRLDLVYFMNGRSRLSTTDGRYHRKGFQDREEYSVFSVRPSVRINTTSRSHLEIGNMFNYDMYDGSGNSGYIGGNDDTRISNVFYFDFRWTY